QRVMTDISSTNQSSSLQPEDGENTSPALPVNEEDCLRFEALLDSGMAESQVRPGGLLTGQPSSNAEENSSGQTESSSSETNQPSSQSSTSTPQSQTSQTSQNSPTSQNSKDDSSGSGTNSGGGSSKQSSEANQSISDGSVAPVIGQSILSSLGISSSAPGG